jgi:hypothetical protein
LDRQGNPAVQVLVRRLYIQEVERMKKAAERQRGKRSGAKRAGEKDVVGAKEVIEISDSSDEEDASRMTSRRTAAQGNADRWAKQNAMRELAKDARNASSTEDLADLVRSFLDTMVGWRSKVITLA